MFHPKMALKKMYNYKADKYDTFEYLCCKFTWDEEVVLLVNLYRLPYSAKHRCTIKMFLDEFEKLISDLMNEN